MTPQPIDKKSLSKIHKKYGSKMHYHYGTDGTFDTYVYRIAVIQPNGALWDLSWDDVKQWCGDRGIKTVPELFRVEMDGDVHERLFDEVKQSANQEESTLDSRHIREGVCVRWDVDHHCYILKEKSHLFGVLEGYARDDGSYVDTEELT